jgi:D-arabinose 1-dehydrogenase-like Zn-dependent alcohol dehydrogenase
MSFTPIELFMRDPLIMASINGNVEEMRELVQLAAAGKVKTHVGRVASLSEINQVLGDLGQGKYIGRAIIDNMTK